MCKDPNKQIGNSVGEMNPDAMVTMGGAVGGRAVRAVRRGGPALVWL